MPRSAQEQFRHCVWQRGILQTGSMMAICLLLLLTYRNGWGWEQGRNALLGGWLGGLLYGWYLYWRTAR